MAALIEKPLGLYVAQQNTGILDVSFNPDLGANDSLSILATIEAGTQPQWFAEYKDKIYSVSRTGFPDNSSTSGGIFAFKRSPKPAQGSDSLILFDTETSHGQGGVHCDVNHDGTIIAAANIEGSSMAVYPLKPDGSIGAATYTVQYTLKEPGPGAGTSQTEPYPHEAAFDTTGKFLFVPARGEDRVHVYSVPAANKVSQLDDIVVPPGTGPRHTAFRPNVAGKDYLYILGELDNTIRVYTIDYSQAAHQKLKFTLHQTISTLGLGLPPTPPNRASLASEVAFTSDGKFAYASNRNTTGAESDTFAVYTINDTDPANHLTYIHLEKTLGKIPRHFALSPDKKNRYLAVANEYSNDLVVFERDETSGLMKGVKGRLKLGDALFVARNGPACMLWK
ncbi:hypothetical protein B0A52_09914 [Exophiala mesophila]|uniref:6-phosphogluconolactonase n=1 Tax=Exophiala mesophila TaxID=212818 RepID=A0A438MSV8_EXOME|nr:hypothetical protein B0A52_09914 [Exophiala mesophila]